MDDTAKKGTIVVFGGSGFIGTHLLRRLADAGDHHVISMDLKAPQTRIGGVGYRKVDVRNLEGVRLPTDTVRIYNLAAVHTTPGHATHEYYDTNVAGALEVIKLAESVDVKEIVFSSSISIYGPGEDRKTETSIPAPTSAYGSSKFLAEKIHRNWLEGADDRKLVIARPAVVFGLGEGGNFTRLASLCRKGLFPYPGRRDTIKSCISVDDLLDAIEFARNSAPRYVLFNGAYPQRYTIEQIVNAFISKHFPKTQVMNVPQWILISAAKMLSVVDFFNLGIHPERVLKLIRSTDVYPQWLIENGKEFPNALEEALDKWGRESNGQFN